jgi:hypothetical protein
VRGVRSDRGVLVEEAPRRRVARVGQLDLEFVQRELDAGVEAGNHRDGANDLVADPEVGADNGLVPRFGRARDAGNGRLGKVHERRAFGVQRCLPLLAAQACEARPGELREVHDRLARPRLLVEAAHDVRVGGRSSPNRIAAAGFAPRTFQWRSITSAGYGSCAPRSRSTASLNGCSAPASRAVSGERRGEASGFEETHNQRSAREAGPAGAAPAAGLRRPAGCSPTSPTTSNTARRRRASSAPTPRRHSADLPTDGQNLAFP